MNKWKTQSTLIALQSNKIEALSNKIETIKQNRSI